MNKQEFMTSFLGKNVEDLVITQTNLDATDLSIADILRNINKIFPSNSRDRNKIASGEKVVSVICRSDYLEPLSGIILMITSDNMELKKDLLSRNYIILLINEKDIKTSKGIKKITDILLSYLVSQYKNTLISLDKFYSRYVYNEDEIFDDDPDDNFYEE